MKNLNRCSRLQALVVISRSRLFGVVCVPFLLAIFASSANSSVITGSIVNWTYNTSPESMVIGDGNSHVSLNWSPESDGAIWVYGTWMNGTSGIASRTTDTNVSDRIWWMTDINQIPDASIFPTHDDVMLAWAPGATITAWYGSPPYNTNTSVAGDFVVLKNILSGYYGVIHIDAIHGYASNNFSLDLTWWFQTDGSANFGTGPALPPPSSGSTTVPTPAAFWLFGSGLIGLFGFVRRSTR